MAERFRDPYDLRIFQQFPRSVRVECWRGRVLSSPDERFLYDVAVETIRGRIHARHYDLSGSGRLPQTWTSQECRHQEMTENIGMVQDHLLDSAGAFTRLGIVRDGIYKRVEYAIEHVFDICAMLNTDLRLDVPGTDEDIVDHLIRHGVLSRAMLKNLKAMKGFRNIVVHRSGAIDDALTFAILQEHIRDFAQFRGEIEAFLRSRDAAADTRD